MISVCASYQQSDQLFAAVAIADRLWRDGRKFVFLRRYWSAKSIFPEWDNQIKRGAFFDVGPYTDNLVIWTEPVDAKWLAFAAENHIYNYLYTSYDQLHLLAISPHLDQYARIIAPSVSQANLIAGRHNLKTLAAIPYTPSLPATHKRSLVQGGRVRLFISLSGSQLGRVELKAFSVLLGVCEANPNVDLTVATSGGLSRKSKVCLAALQDFLGKRCTTLKSRSWHDQVIAMAESDLTVWLPLHDGLGLVGLTSIYVGTPVVSWDVPPINEFLNNGADSILVKCGVSCNQNGRPGVRPNYDDLAEAITTLVREPKFLSALRRNTTSGALFNDKMATVGWRELLPSEG